MAKVVVVQRILPHYRVPFFRALVQTLAEDGHDVVVVYGQERPGSVPRSVVVGEPWAVRIENSYIRVGRTDLVWQPCLAHVRGSELVVVEQANRLLVNYALLARRKMAGPAFAYWGHGRNFQTDRKSGLRERWKRRLLCGADWWFAYTEISKRVMADAGVPADRITVVNNTVDADELAEALRRLGPSDVEAARTALGIRSRNVALYCGGMYPDKRLPFLVAACEEIRRRIPDFEMVIIGDGPDQHLIEDAVRRHAWMHYLGGVYGGDKAKYFAMAQAFLMPGLVGLAIVDSFVAAVPMFTTDVPIHSPEIAYLRNGENGVMTRHDVSAYAEAVAAYFQSSSMQQRLMDGCRDSARDFGVSRMVERFADGVRRCLEAYGHSGRAADESERSGG